jgi:hypothetical protein
MPNIPHCCRLLFLATIVLYFAQHVRARDVTPPPPIVDPWCNSTKVPSYAVGFWTQSVPLDVYYVRCGSHVTVHLSPTWQSGAQCSPKLHATLSPPVPDLYRPRITGGAPFATISFVVHLINNLGVVTIDGSSQLLTVRTLSDSGSGPGCWLDVVVSYDSPNF